MVKAENKIKDGIKKYQQTSFRRFLTRKSCGHSIKEYIGTDIGILREWIEERFVEGMTWDNYGSVWVIDHIVPLWLFDLTDTKELKICWHYKNLMPLFKGDNLHKEGNVFFAYILLREIKGNDYYFNKLFDKVNIEVDVMYKYIQTYQKMLSAK